MRDTASLKILVSAINLETCPITLIDSIRGVLRTQRKCSILEVSLGSQYTSSFEMFSDRFGQSSKFSKKSWNTFWTSKWELWRSSRGRPGTSQINLPGTSLKLQIRTSLGRHFRTSPGRQIGTSPGRQIRTSPGRSNRIFRGCPGDVGGGRPRDILGTNICRLGRQNDFFSHKSN